MPRNHPAKAPAEPLLRRDERTLSASVESTDRATRHVACSARHAGCASAGVDDAEHPTCQGTRRAGPLSGRPSASGGASVTAPQRTSDTWPTRRRRSLARPQLRSSHFARLHPLSRWRSSSLVERLGKAVVVIPNTPQPRSPPASTKTEEAHTGALPQPPRVTESRSWLPRSRSRRSHASA
jgi:hypothetical protein